MFRRLVPSAMSLGLLALAAIPASAGHYVGIVGGVNFADLSIQSGDGTDIETSFRPGFGIGGVLGLGLEEDLTLCFEPMYVQQGAKEEESVADLGVVEVTYALDTIQIPVLFRWSPGSAGVRPLLMVGPVFGFNVGSKANFDLQGLEIGIDMDDLMRTFDAGLALGAGAEFPAGPNLAFFEARYTLGMANVLGAGAIFVGDEPFGLEGKVKTRGFQVFAGFTVPFGR